MNRACYVFWCSRMAQACLIKLDAQGYNLRSLIDDLPTLERCSQKYYDQTVCG
jgi:hypothetical protein